MHELLSISKTNHVLASTLALSQDSWTRQQSQLMSVCSHGQDGHRVSHCKSPLCILCQRWQNETQNRVLRFRAECLQFRFPKANWFFATVGLKDAATGTIRSAVRTLTSAWNGLTKRVHSLLGSFRTVEIATSGADPQAENVHAHALLAVGPGYSGQYRLSGQDWSKAFEQEAGRLARTVQIAKVRNLNHVIDYSLPWSCEGEKGFIARAEEAIGNPQRYVERIRHLSGLHVHQYAGKLASQPIQPDETGLFNDSRSQWRTFEGNLAREANSKSSSPLQLIPISMS
jgi:Replication protein